MGRTSVPDTAYGMAELASDAIGLADHLGVSSFRVLGISFGGMVAQELAVTVPERISRLVLMCTSSGGAGGSSYPLHALADLAAEERERLSTQILDSRFTAEWLDAHPSDRALVDQMARRRGRADGGGAAWGQTPAAGPRAGTTHSTGSGAVNTPTLVASGRFDGIAPPSNGAAIAARIPGAVARIYEGGHAFFLQDPAAMSDAVDFLPLRFVRAHSHRPAQSSLEAAQPCSPVSASQR